MNYKLTKRHYDALYKLREECDYEDSRSDGEVIFVLRNKLSPGIGDKTLSDLEGLGMIEAGINKWFGSLGYRITEPGRREFKAKPQKSIKPKVKHTLRPLSSRLGSPKGRFDR
ncbi:hypothetical protein [Parasedimentitalea maritima]|uniref:Uncharacterized protein n=1 Tax=Parasedimentitalea maritima TaxID=2578117 RepID=A0A6A4RG66_9RHOB|nr:hypothetical protein [Zongyanglinia marina]KAE9627999.1 hypothetical protein GP644_18075 [Zongyanglinia marina]